MMPSSLAPQQHSRVIISQRSSNAFLAARPRRGVCVSTKCQSAVASEVELQVRPASGLQEHQQVANLRAEAYYEEERSRFVASFKKKFAAQEVESLEERTRALPSGAPLCECLVATDPGESSQVVGCIDIRLPSSATTKHPEGVPKEDPSGCYILNVVVGEDRRGQGVGKTLMRAAMQRAASKWASQNLYTHVAADNEVAYRLYTGCGFQELSADAKFGQELSLGKLILLRAVAKDLGL